MKIEVGVRFRTRGAPGISEIVRVTSSLVVYETAIGSFVPVERETFEMRADPRQAIYYVPVKKKRKRRVRK